MDINNPAEVEDMAYVEQYLNGESQKLSDILGVEKIVFPPPERLSEEQSEMLSAEMTRLLRAYHFVPDFPSGLPGIVKYRVLRNHWEDEQVFVSAGEVHLEFCNYAPDECPFPRAYCDCLKLEEEETLDEMDTDRDNNDDFPF